MSARGPWFRTEEQAAARDVAAARYVARITERCIVPGMPDEAIMMRLAARGMAKRDWHLARAFLDPDPQVFSPSKGAAP